MKFLCIYIYILCVFVFFVCGCVDVFMCLCVYVFMCLCVQSGANQLQGVSRLSRGLWWWRRWDQHQMTRDLTCWWREGPSTKQTAGADVINEVKKREGRQNRDERFCDCMWERERERESFVCMCMYVRERERERERESFVCTNLRFRSGRITDKEEIDVTTQMRSVREIFFVTANKIQRFGCFSPIYFWR